MAKKKKKKWFCFLDNAFENAVATSPIPPQCEIKLNDSAPRMTIQTYPINKGHAQ